MKFFDRKLMFANTVFFIFWGNGLLLVSFQSIFSHLCPPPPPTKKKHEI